MPKTDTEKVIFKSIEELSSDNPNLALGIGKFDPYKTLPAKNIENW